MHPALGGRPAGPPRAHWRSGRSRERPVCAAATAQGHPVHRTPVQVPKRSGAARPAARIRPSWPRPGYPGRPGRLPAGRAACARTAPRTGRGAGKRNSPSRRPGAWRPGPWT
jgi:hypothetical protein